MKKISLFVFSLLTSTLFAQQITEAVVLPNGWKLTPAGKSIPLGDLPLNMVSNHAGTLLAVTNNGQSTQTIQLINVKTQTTVDEVVIPKSWYGLAFTKDDKSLYVSGGHDNRILKYDVVNDKLKLTDTISLGKPWPNRIGPAGIALDSNKEVIGKYGMEGEAYDCKISVDGKELYVSGWGTNQILVFNIETKKWTHFIGVGDNPNEMLISPRGDRLFVCNANDNSVSVIDLTTKKVVETLDAALYPNSPSGSTSNSIAINAKTNQLFIANADNNCVAVFDIHEKNHSTPEGFIPVGWYPTTVRIINNKLWVANGKGMSSKPNPFGPSPLRKREEVIHHGFKTKPGNEVEYIAGLFKGSLSIIDLPTAAQLNNYSKAVYANSPYSPDQLNQASIPPSGHPIPRDGSTRSPIKYVFYVIKENRTYDQVLADLPGGNGDTSLLLFGRNVTPNQHFFAEQFVLLDNFYVNSEVSADGHNWTMGGYATDYLEKTWPSSYGG
ncbi:MAG: YncE family protein, partial [Chitinophagia bacterium]|nr:YncE family protein [Chitinophagia bacterium]